VSDSATFSGGYYPGGGLNFDLYDPNGNSVYTTQMTVNGNNTYNANYTLPTNAIAGAYHWAVAYSGDAANNQTTDNGSSTQEQTVVSAPVHPVHFGFDYSEANRFGLDLNDNGLIDLPNTYTYAHPTSLDVTFTITNDATANSTTVYKWYVNTPVIDAEVAETGWSAGPVVLDLPISPDSSGEYETPYTVTCERRSAGVVDSFDVKSVTLRDILIVSMGDSYSSGEGNPEVNAVWAPPTLVPPPLVPIPQLVAP